MPSPRRVPDILKYNFQDIKDAAASARKAYGVIEPTIDRLAKPEDLKALKDLIKLIAEIERRARDGLDYEYVDNGKIPRGVTRAKVSQTTKTS